ncbi:hypothetical protein CQ14_11795 [Bradyrhizobium lablabi]|uniref:Uncharacterized protein n=1 Tax=Bradyrhizobium lablabi TaxID=722472 RepID=A0A0R3MSQ0_9BRAD|nr:hypothetical protein CQ14_11795 [Bradyrhizobium lablabi]
MLDNGVVGIEFMKPFPGPIGYAVHELSQNLFWAWMIRHGASPLRRLLAVDQTMLSRVDQRAEG